ncbi:hypothetical protein SAMN04515692_11443 [Leifsonia sp. CL147]|nr:hypothetical protein SAMN04515694_11444 [Leifsonia sp. CL154]SFL83738.1 hypothetical protein SAMN04515692_11443 [Leifsonia sp. CL147]
MSAGVSNGAARGACETFYKDNMATKKGLRLVGALASTLEDAKQLTISAGGDPSKDGNYSRLPGSQAIVLCGVTGPLEQVGFRGTVLVYYVIPSQSSSGIAVVK